MKATSFVSAIVISLLLAACGGGSGGGITPPPPPVPPQPPVEPQGPNVTYTNVYVDTVRSCQLTSYAQTTRSYEFKCSTTGSEWWAEKRAEYIDYIGMRALSEGIKSWLMTPSSTGLLIPSGQYNVVTGPTGSFICGKPPSTRNESYYCAGKITGTTLAQPYYVIVKFKKQ